MVKRSGSAMKLSVICATSLIVLCLAFSAHGEPLLLGTLEWPPFVSQELTDHGPVTARVRAICAAAGMSLELSFAPWKRVLLDASAGRTHGFYPEYHSAKREKDFYFSEPVGCSVVGLVRRRDVTLAWSRLEDLTAYRIGVVDGYLNTLEFDRLVDQGVLHTVKSNSDVLALRMLEAGRIDAAVMDRAVFKHFVAKDAVSGASPDLVFDKKILAVRSLYVCFPRTPAGKALLERFNQALSTGGFTLKCASEFEAAPLNFL